jgi:hypothetical protein
MKEFVLFAITLKHLGIVLSPQLGVGIRYADSKLFGTSDNLPSDTRRNSLGNSGSISAVVHHKHFQLSSVVDNNSLESIRVDVTGLFVGTVTDNRVRDGSLESTTDATINTPSITPSGILNTIKKITLVTSELLGALLHHSFLVKRKGARHFILS